MLADFPRVRSVTRTCGRRRYFESSFRAVEAESTLRAVGEKASRNSYLPRDGVLRFSGTLTPPHEEAVGLFEGLGEWCSFAPG